MLLRATGGLSFFNTSPMNLSTLGEAGIKAWGQPGAVLYDIKYVLPRNAVDGRL